MARRWWLSQLNVLATLTLLGMLFIMVNWVASRNFLRVDLTQSQLTVLSEKTRQVLSHLEDPVTIIVFHQPVLPNGRPNRLYGLIQDLLKEYERLSGKLTIEYVDPDRDIARAKQLAEQFEIDRLNLVVFQSGAQRKYLADTELAEYDYTTVAVGGEPRLRNFTGEAAFTSAIIGVTQAEQPLVWVATGHGEKSIESEEPDGLAAFKRALERENMRLKPVTLLERREVPEEVKLVIVAGPTRRFVQEELVLLLGWLDGGGRLLCLLDPLHDTGVEELLERWGVVVGDDIVVDPARQIPFVSAANLFVTTYTQHPIVEKMETLMTLFPLARSVRPAVEDASGLTVKPLAMTSPQGWAETQTESTTFAFDPETDLKGPVAVATAVERSASTPTRLVAFGDSDFVSNTQLGNVGNLDFVLGAIHWLIAQERLIGIGPKPIETIKLNLTAVQLRRIFWLSVAILPLACVALGIGVWWLRKK